MRNLLEGEQRGDPQFVDVAVAVNDHDDVYDYDQ
jgi:hypothetical protein